MEVRVRYALLVLRAADRAQLRLLLGHAACASLCATADGRAGTRPTGPFCSYALSACLHSGGTWRKCKAAAQSYCPIGGLSHRKDQYREALNVVQKKTNDTYNTPAALA